MNTDPHDISGFALVEAILSMTIITLFVALFAGISAHVHYQASSMISRSHALLLAQEGLEAARAMRNEDFSALIDGQHGLSLNAGMWEFSGNEDISGNFRRVIVIETKDPETKKVTASVEWEERESFPAIVLSTIFSDWK